MSRKDPYTFPPVVIFLLITLAFSSLFYVLIISTGKLGAGRGSYVFGLMWSPGIAALLTCKLTRRPLSTLGWQWPARRYVVLSVVLPLAYAFVAYAAVWLTGLGRFYDSKFVGEIARAYGWESLAPPLVIAFYFLFVATIGVVRSTASALGEEIGWRGFLVPELAQKMGYTRASLLSGVIWAAWHAPILLFADYNSGTPAAYALTCFTVMVVGMSFAFAWVRLKSGSLWTAAILHASHNAFIQAFFTPLTADTGSTAYWIDEFGAALPVVIIAVALFFWLRRAEVEQPQAVATPL